MKSIFAFLLCLLPLFTANSSVKASVTIVPFCKCDKKVDDFPFIGSIENVNNYSSGSGTVIGDGSFVLTARHLVTHDGSQRGMVLDGSNFVFKIDNKIFKIEKVYAHDFADIAILKIEGSFDKTAKLSFSDYFIGKNFYGAGFGKSSERPLFNEIEWDIPYGTKRVYKNTITKQLMNAYAYGSSVQLDKSLIFIVRDPYSLGKIGGAISGEGIHGPGDSGGGVFIIENDELHVFGVISAMTTDAPIQGIIADLFIAKNWISSIVSEAYASPKPRVLEEQKTHLQLKSDLIYNFPLFFDNNEWLAIQNTRRKRKAR